ncbi:MAG: DUF302 domain-containing protein [Salinivirgaceae bacterium]
MKYYISKTISTDFESAITRITDTLKEQGFGVLSEINIQEKFNEKLNVDFRKYTILGACNPPSAHKAIEAESQIGTMLPCNVVVQEIAEKQIEIAAIDPTASMMAVENKDVRAIAQEIKAKLEKVIASV